MATETITQITQPPEFIEAAAKPYITELQQAVGGFKGADLSKVYGLQYQGRPIWGAPIQKSRDYSGH